MLRNRAMWCALLMLCSTTVFAAEKAAARKPSGRSETLACRFGTEDRHARIAVVVIGGRTDSFAYYSKWKPRTCSIYLQRNRDSYSKWADTGNITTVNLERGAFLIEHKPGEYHFIFRDIDRERYCGMDGVINGSLIIKRGSDQCVLDGEIMVEGAPLGAAYARQEEEPPAPVAVAPETAPASAPPPVAVAPETVPESAPSGAAASTLPQQNAEPTPPAPTAAALPEAAARTSETAEVTQKPPAAAATEKAAESPSSNPFRSFFRTFTQPRTPEGQSP